MTKGKKTEKLELMTEDAFREQVVVPLFANQGYSFTKTTCGVDEEGKDIIAAKKDAFDLITVASIQVKVGNVNLGRKPANSLLELLSQVRTMIEARINLPGFDFSGVPHKVFVVCSGKISANARAHILREVKSQITFLDIDDIIKAIDEIMPSFWFDSVPEKESYCDLVRERLLKVPRIPLPPLPGGQDRVDPYVEVGLYRIMAEPSSSHNISVEHLSTGDILKLRRSILIVGAPGSGKSQFLRKLTESIIAECAAEYYGASTTLPVFLHARELLCQVGSFEDIIVREVIRDRGAGRDAEIFKSLIEESKITIIIDGLDEIRVTNEFLSNLASLKSFLQEYRKAQVIIASRDVEAANAVRQELDLDLYRMKDPSIAQAESLLESILEGRDLNLTEAKEVLRRMREVHGLGLNPFIVTIFAASQSKKGKIDVMPSLYGMFERYADLMLGKWDEDKGVALYHEYKVKERVMTRWAAKLHLQGVTQSSVKSFEEEVFHFLREINYEGDQKSLLDELFRSGLLQADGKNVFFSHLLFQEFFASKSDFQDSELERMLTDEWCRNVFAFHVGGEGSDIDRLQRFLLHASVETGARRFTAALTLAYTVQHLFLAPYSERSRVAKELVALVAEYLKTYDYARMPLVSFLHDYLKIRSAFSGSLAESFLPALKDDKGTLNDYCNFVYIIACADSGYLKDVVKEIDGFRTEDKRLFLGLLVQMFFVRVIRRASADERELARHRISRLEKKCSSLMGEVFEEFRAFALELRVGEIYAQQELEASAPPAGSAVQYTFDL